MNNRVKFWAAFLVWMILGYIRFPVTANAEYTSTTDAMSRDMKIDQTFEDLKNTPAPDDFKRKEDMTRPLSQILSPSQIFDELIQPEYKKIKMDLDFEEVKLIDILRTLSEAGHFNVVLDPILKDYSIEIHLKEVTISNALMVLSNAFGLGFNKVGNSLYVTTKEKIKSENITSRVIRLKNLNVNDAKALIKGLIDTVNISEETNSIVLVGTPEQILEVEGLLKGMDNPMPQVILEAKIIEINKDALKDLGVDWSDSMTITYQESGRPVELADTENPPGSVYQIYQFARSPVRLEMIIKMLENDNKAKVLSNPRVTTLNNKEAEIFVGDRIPYTVTTVSGGVATTDVRFEEPGIRLKITPSIIEDNFVVIKVQPEVSFIFSFRGPDSQYPWVKKREATAFVRVQNKQPFIIGGLLNQEDKNNYYKVPLLGDIPLLGNLFSYEKHTVADTELIIAIIPYVVGEGAASAETSKLP